MEQGKTNRVERVLNLSVGTVFLLVGVWMLISDGADVVFWLRMQNAVQVPGQLLTVKLAGGDGAIGSIVTYRYDFKGKTYTGNRPAIHQTADNFGEFQRSLYNRLHDAHEKSRNVPVFVNSDNPFLSSLDLTLRFNCVVLPLFLCAGFMLGGLYMLLGGFHRKQKLNYAPENPFDAIRAESSAWLFVQHKMPIIYRTPLSSLAGWYTLGIVFIAFCFLICPFRELPKGMIVFMVLISGAILFAPLTLAGRFLCMDEWGISQNAVGFQWRASWKQIADWRTIAILMPMDHCEWEIHVFLKMITGEVVRVHPWLLTQTRLAELKSCLTHQVGPPKSLEHPVLPPNANRNLEWKWI